MSNREKHAEILEAASLPDFYPGKTVDQFSQSDIDNYVELHGAESYVDRVKVDKRFKTLSDLDKQIEEKQQETGTGKVSRSEFEKVQKQVSDRKVPYERLDDLLIRAKEFGMTED